MTAVDAVLCPATDAHAVELARTMRAVDVAEVEAMCGKSPLEGLRLSLKSSSHAVTALDANGRVICMFGVCSMGFLSNEGCPWLLGSDLIATHWRQFLRRSRKYLAAMLELYPELANSVDARAVQSVRWLQWLGFTVDRPEPVGVDGAPLRRFRMVKGMSVQKSTVAEIEASDNFAELIAEYASESAIDGLPSPAGRLDIYRHLENSGMLHVFSATLGGRLIGFISVLAPVLPHYGVSVAVSESFFVAKEHRRTMAGLKLLRAAEAKARDLGSPGLLVSAPYGGKLFQLLPRLGYTETNRIFFKKASDV
jgi:GNAT superfamily N-acetyltransferase